MEDFETPSEAFKATLKYWYFVISAYCTRLGINVELACGRSCIYDTHCILTL